MKLDAGALIRKLKQKEELPNIIVASGEESYFRSQISTLLQEYLFDGLDATNREITVFERKTDLKEVEAVINNYPFFGGKSLVILKDEKLFSTDDGKKQKKTTLSDTKKKKFKEQQEKLLEILSDVPEYCTVLIDTPNFDKRVKLYKNLEKEGIVCECESIRTYNIAPWLHALAKDLGGKLEFAAVGTIEQYLSFLEYAPLQLLTQEMEKLSIYAGERKVWTKEDVQTVFADLPEVGKYALANAVADRRLKDALLLLKEEYIKSTDKSKTFAMLCGYIAAQLRKLMRAKEFIAEGFKQQQIAEIMKIPSYGAKILVGQTKNFSAEALREAIIKLSWANAQAREDGRDWPRLEEILVKLMNT